MGITLSRASAEIFVPDGVAAEHALARTTHLAIGAHQDDLEIFAPDAILACHGSNDAWFTGVVVTDGRGSPRAGTFSTMSDDDMAAVRREEQKKAAIIGSYSAQFLLDHPSAAVKDATVQEVRGDLASILLATRPRILYTHNLADKHDTHVAVALRVIEAVRGLPREARPARVLGCEVWRDLDWLTGSDRITLTVEGSEALQSALLSIFESQIAGGKRYDLAAMGRRRANATFNESHEVDQASGACLAMDLTPLIRDETMAPADLMRGALERFQEDVLARVVRFSPAP